MQSKLEKIGIEERKNETLKSDYIADNQYSANHPDAKSDGDKLGKGTGHGGHTHFLPDQTKASTTIDYSNFDTSKGGNNVDIESRNKATNYSLYNQNYQYGAHLIDTEENLRNGQFTL